MSTETMERDIQQLKSTVAELQADLHCAEQMIAHLMTCASSAEPPRRADVQPRPPAKPMATIDESVVAVHIDGPWRTEAMAEVPGD